MIKHVALGKDGFFEVEQWRADHMKELQCKHCGITLCIYLQGSPHELIEFKVMTALSGAEKTYQIKLQELENPEKPLRMGREKAKQEMLATLKEKFGEEWYDKWLTYEDNDYEACARVLAAWMTHDGNECTNWVIEDVPYTPFHYCIQIEEVKNETI